MVSINHKKRAISSHRRSLAQGSAAQLQLSSRAGTAKEGPSFRTRTLTIIKESRFQRIEAGHGPLRQQFKSWVIKIQLCVFTIRFLPNCHLFSTMTSLLYTKTKRFLHSPRSHEQVKTKQPKNVVRSIVSVLGI